MVSAGRLLQRCRTREAVCRQPAHSQPQPGPGREHNGGQFKGAVGGDEVEEIGAFGHVGATHVAKRGAENQGIGQRLAQAGNDQNAPGETAQANARVVTNVERRHRVIHLRITISDRLLEVLLQRRPHAFGQDLIGPVGPLIGHGGRDEKGGPEHHKHQLDTAIGKDPPRNVSQQHRAPGGEIEMPAAIQLIVRPARPVGAGTAPCWAAVGRHPPGRDPHRRPDTARRTGSPWQRPWLRCDWPHRRSSSSQCCWRCSSNAATFMIRPPSARRPPAPAPHALRRRRDRQ